MANTQRQIPTRRCTGCGEHFPKPSLIRIVRLPSSEIRLDESGKLSGRGAYLCRSAACLKKAKKGARLDKSLECQIPEEVYARLEEELSV